MGRLRRLPFEGSSGHDRSAFLTPASKDEVLLRPVWMSCMAASDRHPPGLMVNVGLGDQSTGEQGKSRVHRE